MDFDDAKENIQPLAHGRNASILQASLSVHSTQELLAQRRELERDIHKYSGDDPLSVWCNYIEWIEQSFPSGGKESGLQEVLAKCLTRFESEERYFQDRRMIKIYIKYIDALKNPAECYQQLSNAGIGTMVADFYIAWAYCYDLCDNTRRADEIFRLGITCRAQPLEDLKEAHQHFGFTVAQRLLYKDDEDAQEEASRQLSERRLALSSLRGHRRKQMVGSIRTGAAIKEDGPGTIKAENSSPNQRSNARVQVFKDENQNPNFIPNPTTSTEPAANEESKSVARSIIDAQRDQENLTEPGPWNKPHAKGKLFSKKVLKNDLGFEIHQDDGEQDVDMISSDIITMTLEETKFDKPLKFPMNFQRIAYNKKQADWITPITIEEWPEKNTVAQYNKCKIYPRPNVELTPEMVKAYAFLKKRNIQNDFTKKHDIYLGCGAEYNLRFYPHFAKQSNPQILSALDELYVPEKLPALTVAFDEIYNLKEKVERSFEEILAKRGKRNETIIVTTDMEETICKANDKVQRRKSFFPMRKSIAPCANKGPMRKFSVMSGCPEENEVSDASVIYVPIDEGEIAMPKSLSIIKKDLTPPDANQSADLLAYASQGAIPKIFSKLNNDISVKQVSVNSQTALFEDCLKAKTLKNVSKMQDDLETAAFTSQGAKPKILSTAENDEKEITLKQLSVSSQAATSLVENKLKDKTFENISTSKQNFEPVTQEPSKEEIETAAVEPFQIYQDESLVSVSAQKSIAAPAENNENVFQFKTPALPPTNSIQTKASKLPFEIFEDTTSTVAAKPDYACGTGGYFDADETCSTQTFNIFLRAQSVSTPKMKPEPQRMFGNILKETVTSSHEQKDEELQPASASVATISMSDMGEDNLQAAAVTIFSPQRKQLSTILETSEHGTTQGTHTTGASTKSTISSPEFEQETQHQAATPSVQHQPTLDTVREQTFEDSNPHSIGNKVESMLSNLNIENKNKNVAVASESPPSVIRQEKVHGGRLDFSIFENDKQQAGNFSRLVEKEDTHTGYAIKPVRFQEDKTETISKMLLMPSQRAVLQEDKTETISKIIMPTHQPMDYQEDKTETITKMLLAPSQPIRFEEDKTETISKMLLAPPQPMQFEEDKTENIPNLMLAPSLAPPSTGNEEKSIIKETENQDHIFEFFSQSPPKSSKYGYAKAQPGLTRNATESRTPIALGSKRLCDRGTPEVQRLTTKSTTLFGDPATKPKSVLRDSFLPDFSLMDETQPKTQQSKNTKPKSVLRDSFIPDFSLFEDGLPQKPQAKPANESFLPDFSHIAETQSKITKPKSVLRDSFLPECSLDEGRQQHQNITNSSFLPDLIPETQVLANSSVIADSQPLHASNIRMKHNSMKSSSQAFSNDSIIADSQPTQHKSSSRVASNSMKSSSQAFSNDSIVADSQPTHHKSSSRVASNSSRTTNLQSSFLPEFSMIPETQPTSHGGEGQPASFKNILTDSFMKDFSEIKEPPPIPMDVKEMTMMQPNKNNSTLKLLEETISQKTNETISKPSAYNSLKLSTQGDKSQKNPLEVRQSEQDKFFELNAETEMFGTNISMIRNSTWLPNHGPTSMPKQLSQIQEDSLHIKHEKFSSSGSQNQSQRSQQESQLPKPSLSFLSKSKHSHEVVNLSIDISKSEWAAINAKKLDSKQQLHSHTANTNVVDDDDFGEMSIYYKHTPKTPKAQVHVWDVPEEDAFKTPASNRYVHIEPDLNQTQHVIEKISFDPNVNPFNVDLITAFLDQIHFSSYIQDLDTCQLQGTIYRLKAGASFKINNIGFDVIKLIGEGAYGAIFCGKEKKSGKQVALKQEKPANFWEYYICLEVQSRILVDEMLPAFMCVEHALIGNNSSVLVSQFSEYGSLIAVCNKIKKITLKNVDEYVVMLLTSELLEIMDHLHAVNIIHADIKADNFLLMNKIKYPSKERSLQLIDFGVSIDMKQFKHNQTFSYIHNDNYFKCIEMREERPWTYQLDLYGLAGVIHVLLFAKYMEVERKSNGIWMHKTHVPRYFNRSLWDTIFKTLLNIRDCKSMPNLQNLRALLKEVIVEKEKYVTKMVQEFNNALDR